MARKNLKRDTPILARKKECTGCMACVDSCNHNALKSYLDTDGHLYPKLDVKKCIKCGLCSKSCPIINKTYYSQQKTFSKPFTAWANNDELRMKSASGGIFAAIAHQFILDGGIVVGASIEGCNINHIIIESIEELHKLQGSKYQQGDLSGIYIEIKHKLDQNQKVLFSGTPCQIGGLQGFLKNKEYPNLFTIDLICGGFPSILPMNLFIRNNKNQIKTIISFRDKTNGWKSHGYKYSLKVIDDKNNVVNFGNNNLPINAFDSGLTKRYSCYNCKFATANRISNLTIGDFWGDIDYPEQHYKGLSLVVVHNERGMSLLNLSNITYHEVNWDKAIKKNTRMIYGKNKLNIHIVRLFIKPIFKYMPYASICKIYNGTGILGIISRAISWLLSKWRDLANKKYINHFSLKTKSIEQI